ncbi:MAG: nitronate monooxygenase [Flammeovirgaceae bacterium]|nr:nitronate monooxygenase [Flammeovirgaceae bacterium]
MSLPKTKLTEMLGIEYPIIMAPMFLISNAEMVLAALDSGITAAIPALNYRTDKELKEAIIEIKSKSSKPFGINLIVNKSNPRYKPQLKICVEQNVNFIITSLGNPKETIEQCKAKGIKVFCDVVDLTYAKKVEDLGADALIAVNSEAGGHAGNLSAEELIPLLKNNCSIPVISAGGVATRKEIDKKLALGADGFSIGTIFIASKEAPVSEDYKQALIQYGAKDIVKTTKLSGSALTVINTPYVQKTGTKASFLERILLKNKTLKKYVKMLVAFRGMKMVEKAALSTTYKTVWCAGPTIEHIHSVRPAREIIKDLLG